MRGEYQFNKTKHFKNLTQKQKEHLQFLADQANVYGVVYMSDDAFWDYINQFPGMKHMLLEYSTAFMLAVMYSLLKDFKD